MNVRRFALSLLGVSLLAKADFEPHISEVIYKKPADAQKIVGFGGMAISQELYHFMQELLPKGSVILEFGSGFGTGQLAKHFKMYSVEHDAQWVNKYNSQYVHAPIRGSWYDVNVVKANIPEKYDAILIDGPPRRIGRRGFLDNIHLFNVNVPLIFDDVHIESEWQIMFDTAKRLRRNCVLYVCESKGWGVIYPE